jgi:glycosyltransferase involved in cell wall biosynthesis
LVVLVLPGSLDTPTGGYVYDRRMVNGLRDLGWHVDVCSLSGDFPWPSDAALEQAKAALSSIPDGLTVLVDGLAGGAMPSVMAGEAMRLRLVSLLHHPLADETGLPKADAAKLETSERRALAAVRRVVVTSQATAARVTQLFGIVPSLITVVEPGVDRGPLTTGSQSTTCELLCVATISPRKGYDTLLRALAMIADRDWRLTVVGSLHSYPQSVDQLRNGIRSAGLERRVSLVGEADAATISAYYQRSDLFVLATEYEGYGMVVAEALAHGLPVVSTPVGAIPGLVGADAGVIVPVGDADRLAGAIRSVLDDDGLRRRLTDGAVRARDRLPSWEAASRQMAEVLTGVALDE